MSMNNNQQDAVESQIGALPCWQGEIQIAALPGGITNLNYRVTDNEGEYVVRLGKDIPEHHILRFNELAASQAASSAGLAPAVKYHAPGTLVLDYIPSRTLTPEAVRQPDTLVAIVDLLRRCHTEVPLHLRGASLIFWVFHVVRDYVSELHASDSSYRDQLDDWLDVARRLEADAGPFDIVFGHNDLLAANLLDDGKRLWLIDWEYAGFNTPLFDLGGLAANNGFSEPEEIRMLELYFAEELSRLRHRQYQAMKCSALLRETLWSMVSEIHSQIDFDYSQYTAENRLRFENALQAYENA